MALLTTQKKIVGPAQFELDLEVRIKRAGRPPWFSIFSISYVAYDMFIFPAKNLILYLGSEGTKLEFSTVGDRFLQYIFL